MDVQPQIDLPPTAGDADGEPAARTPAATVGGAATSDPERREDAMEDGELLDTDPMEDNNEITMEDVEVDEMEIDERVRAAMTAADGAEERLEIERVRHRKAVEEAERLEECAESQQQAADALTAKLDEMERALGTLENAMTEKEVVLNAKEQEHRKQIMRQWNLERLIRDKHEEIANEHTKLGHADEQLFLLADEISAKRAAIVAKTGELCKAQSDLGKLTRAHAATISEVDKEKLKAAAKEELKNLFTEHIISSALPETTVAGRYVLSVPLKKDDAEAALPEVNAASDDVATAKIVLREDGLHQIHVIATTRKASSRLAAKGIPIRGGQLRMKRIVAEPSFHVNIKGYPGLQLWMPISLSEDEVRTLFRVFGADIESVDYDKATCSANATFETMHELCKFVAIDGVVIDGFPIRIEQML